MSESRSNIGFNFSNQPSNVFDEEKWQYLYWLQGKNDLINIPAFTFLALVCVCGLIGNSLILIVYSRKKNKTPTVILIQFIAVMDTITNLFIVPGTIYTIGHTWTYTNVLVCKAYYFFNSFISWTSAILLVVVAIIRYRKICKPFGRQLNNRETKIICACVVGLSLVFSLPFAIFYGQITVDTGHKGIQGYNCAVADQSIWPTVCHGLYILVFMACCVTLTTLYCFIGSEARRRKVSHSRVSIPPSRRPKLMEKLRKSVKTPPPDNERSDDVLKRNDLSQVQVDFSPENSNEPDTESSDIDAPTPRPTADRAVVSKVTSTDICTVSNTTNQTSTNPSQAHNKTAKTGEKTSGKTTRMLLATSVIYVISYLATLTMILLNVVLKLNGRLGLLQASILNVVIVLYLINSAANPVIYSVCNQIFRRDCFSLFQRLVYRGS
ncbi:muscarinic acetylcholine receptor M2-like [Physella acuta]|uniref:muscarinic acetylcholine receptor M2-like n=1 Tax=Physella acuta TaxID=109671 RepID=UPI0027DDF7A8|nr:muscarinic acetylcholine receptor M2-like [Physella acuta]